MLGYIFFPLKFQTSIPSHPIRFAFTIDVEDKNGPIPNLIECDLDEYGNYGIDYILDSFEKYNMKATFFVNVYEENLYTGQYEHYMEQLLQKIDTNGHEVGLHGHHDRTRDFYSKPINEYTYEEQYEIIKKGCEIIQNSIQKYPVSFRAGGFAINDNTFQALQNNGILYDSSYYYQRQENTFETYHSLNQVCKIDKLIEFPLIYAINHHGKETVLDLNNMSYEEIIEILEQMKQRKDFSQAQIILHSFSFIRQSGKHNEIPVFVEPNHSAYGPDKTMIDKFERLLQYIAKDEQIQVVPVKDLIRTTDTNFTEFTKGDGIFHTGNLISKCKAAFFKFTSQNPNFKLYPPPELTSEYIEISKKGGKIICNNIYPIQYSPQYAWYLLNKDTKEVLKKTTYSNEPQITFNLDENVHYNIIAYVKFSTGERYSIEMTIE